MLASNVGMSVGDGAGGEEEDGEGARREGAGDKIRSTCNELLGSL